MGLSKFICLGILCIEFCNFFLLFVKKKKSLAKNQLKLGWWFGLILMIFYQKIVFVCYIWQVRFQEPAKLTLIEDFFNLQTVFLKIKFSIALLKCGFSVAITF